MREVRRHTADDAKLFWGSLRFRIPTVLSWSRFWQLFFRVGSRIRGWFGARPRRTKRGHCSSSPSTEAAPPAEPEAVSGTSGSAEGSEDANDQSSLAKASSQKKAKQETLPFESTRGRFDKSEPTIVEGEDLDVPTFLRERKPD